MNFPLRFAMAAAFTATACASTPARVASVVSPKAKTGVYRTIAYAGAVNPPENYARAQIPDALRAPLERAIRAELFDRLGYAEAPVESADLVLYSGVGKRIVTKSKETTVPMSRGLQVPDQVRVLDEEVQLGTLVLDAFERETKTHVWRGQVAREAQDNEKVDEERVIENVGRMFERFPPAADN